MDPVAQHVSSKTHFRESTDASGPWAGFRPKGKKGLLSFFHVSTQSVASQTMKRITVGTQPHGPHSFCLTECRTTDGHKSTAFCWISLNGFLSRILAKCLAEDRFRSRILQMRGWPGKQTEWEATESHSSGMPAMTSMGLCKGWSMLIDGKRLAISGFCLSVCLSRVVAVNP